MSWLGRCWLCGDTDVACADFKKLRWCRTCWFIQVAAQEVLLSPVGRDEPKQENLLLLVDGEDE